MTNIPDMENDSLPGPLDNGKSTFAMEENADREPNLRRIQTAGSINLSPELFEKLYLSPKNSVSNNLRTTFGNPTPMYDLALNLALI
jgi:uncharacterized protein